MFADQPSRHVWCLLPFSKNSSPYSSFASGDACSQALLSSLSVASLLIMLVLWKPGSMIWTLHPYISSSRLRNMRQMTNRRITHYSHHKRSQSLGYAESHAKNPLTDGSRSQFIHVYNCFQLAIDL